MTLYGQSQMASASNTSKQSTSFSMTDVGNARRFVQLQQEKVTFVPGLGFLIWDGSRWLLDNSNKCMQYAIQTVEKMEEEASSLEDLDQRQKLMKWVNRSKTVSRLNAMLLLAQSNPLIIKDGDCFDTDPYILVASNGVVDLKSGQLLPHDSCRMVSRMTKIIYDRQASCPEWIAFLQKVFDGDKELISYIQRAVGYSLTGDTTEQCFFFLYGKGSNGKTVFSEILLKLLGEYGVKISKELFAVSKRDANDHTAAIARLNRARVAVGSEITQHFRLDEGKLKELTDFGTIQARRLYQETEEFKKQTKIWFYGNYLIDIRGTDHGIWRRYVIIPFDVTIEEAERDKHLYEKLERELSGILTWAVQGCLEWQKHGLELPERLQQLRDNYQTSSDIKGTFINECCEVGEQLTVTSSALLQAYQEWCQRNGEEPESQNRLGRYLKEKGFENSRVRKVTIWSGLRLK